MTWPRVGGLRALELGTPGPLRERLNALVLAGAKRATAGRLAEYAEEGEEIEHIGERLALVDDDLRQIGTVEVTRIEFHPFAEVPWEFAAAEGEGDENIAQWRAGHARFWADAGTPVDDDTPIACIWFDLL